MLQLIRLEVPDTPELKNHKVAIFKMFCQHCLNRLFVGELRYGMADRRQNYHNRLQKEVKAYHETGNAEHLLNIANYCILEWIAPGHPKHHFDNTVDSVTR